MKPTSPLRRLLKRRKLILSLSLFTIVTSTMADRITYNYDSSGNRTDSHRVIVYTRGTDPGKSALKKSQRYLDSLSLARIAIYPNPTEGDLRIDITGIEDFNDTELTVRSLTGSVLDKLTPLDVSNEIDLTGYADGTYLVIIRLKDQATNWKIIKK